MTFEIRPIGIEQAGQMAEVHLTAFASSMLTKLGRGAVTRYYEWQFTDIELYQKEVHALGAFHDGTMAAFTIFGIPRNARNGFLRKNALYLTMMTICRAHRFDRRQLREALAAGVNLLRRIVRRSPAMKPDPVVAGQLSYGILVTAAHRDYEGRGLGSVLMRRIEVEARARGVWRIHLSVRATNESATKIYEVLGYRKVVDATGKWAGNLMTKELKPL